MGELQTVLLNFKNSQKNFDDVSNILTLLISPSFGQKIASTK
jgi:hypothetical protein